MAMMNVLQSKLTFSKTENERELKLICNEEEMTDDEKVAKTCSAEGSKICFKYAGYDD